MHLSSHATPASHGTHTHTWHGGEKEGRARRQHTLVAACRPCAALRVCLPRSPAALVLRSQGGSHANGTERDEGEVCEGAVSASRPRAFFCPAPHTHTPPHSHTVESEARCVCVTRAAIAQRHSQARSAPDGSMVAGAGGQMDCAVPSGGAVEGGRLGWEMSSPGLADFANPPGCTALHCTAHRRMLSLYARAVAVAS